jgi:putative endonuclease
MEKYYYIYIMASKKNGTLYVGMTDDIIRRNMEHKLKKYDGFTARNNVDNLVYFQKEPDLNAAFELEKKLKGLLRRKKISIIEETNHEWNDLTHSL